MIIIELYKFMIFQTQATAERNIYFLLGIKNKNILDFFSKLK